MNNDSLFGNIFPFIFGIYTKNILSCPRDLPLISTLTWNKPKLNPVPKLPILRHLYTQMYPLTPDPWPLPRSKFDLINIHMTHDESNLKARLKSPSDYTVFRQNALKTTLDRFASPPPASRTPGSLYDHPLHPLPLHESSSLRNRPFTWKPSSIALLNNNGGIQ